MYRCTHCGNLETSDADSEAFKTCQTSHGEQCDACRKLSILDTQISDAKNLLEGLLHQRRELKSQANELHNSIIHRMPLEVATTVFELYMSDWELPSDPKDAVIQSPFVLGAVCQAWRRIVWSTPQLWADISMDLSATRLIVAKHGLEKFSTKAQLLSEYIARSGTRPLHITLDAKNGVGRDCFYCIDPIIDIVNKCSRRWRDLDLELPAWVMTCFVGHVDDPDVESCVAPLLEGMRFHNTTEEVNAIVFGTSGDIFHGRPPKVKSAPKRVDFLCLRFPLINIEWNNVTTMTASRASIDEVFDLLRSAPQLVDCSIFETRRARIEGLWSIPPIVHPNLKVLDISFDFPVFIQRFLSIVTLPALERLTCNLHNLEFSVDTFTSFLVRSCPEPGSNVNTHLQKLGLIQANFPEGGAPLIQICQATPALVELQLMPTFSGMEASLDTFYRALSNDPLASGAAAGDQSAFEPTEVIADQDPTHAVNEQPLLLPLLEIFFTFTRHGSTFPWDLVPGFFLPFPSKPTQRRPLDILDIGCLLVTGSDPVSQPVIDPKTMALFRALIRDGVGLRIHEDTATESTDLID